MAVNKSAGRKRRPATTPEGRENQLISLAVDLAEQQLLNGTASSQVITHYLKMSSTREKLEQEKLKNENLLLSAKKDQIAAGQRMEELFTEAIKVMKTYTGQTESVEEFNDFEGFNGL